MTRDGQVNSPIDGLGKPARLVKATRRLELHN